MRDDTLPVEYTPREFFQGLASESCRLLRSPGSHQENLCPSVLGLPIDPVDEPKRNQYRNLDELLRARIVQDVLLPIDTSGSLHSRFWSQTHVHGQVGWMPRLPAGRQAFLLQERAGQ